MRRRTSLPSKRIYNAKVIESSRRGTENVAFGGKYDLKNDKRSAPTAIAWAIQKSARSLTFGFERERVENGERMCVCFCDT